jgi:signal transduction histidine kinase
MDVVDTGPGGSPAQDRHTAAPPPRRLSLGTRLALSVAGSVAIVILALTVAGLAFAERQLRADLLETARVTAVALADDIEAHGEPVTSDDFLPVLGDFMNAAADLYAISIFGIDNGTPELIVTTSAVAPPSTALVQQVIASGEEAWSETTPGMAVVAAPVRQNGLLTGAVTAAVSLRPIERLRNTTTMVALGAAVLAIVGITLLIHTLARRLVLRPLDEISRAIMRARGGDLTARADVGPENEQKEVADGLNAMLVELNDLHSSLEQRIGSATSELRDRNAQLVRSYESVLQLRETAARAQQLATVGQTLANVAHQIGTPLNLVSGHVQLLQHELTDPALRRRLTIVQDQNERVASAVRDLLERARPHRESRLVDISTLLDRLVDAIRGRLTASGISVNATIMRTLPKVVADETQLELALLNLISNAVDAMHDGGTLTLNAQHCAKGVRIVVADTGPGIDPEVLPRIFEPWVTTKGPGHGSGLGLSITRDVITQAGGAIDVKSVPGAGVTFTVDLPEAPEAAA